MTRRRHSPEQIIRKLAEGNKLSAGGASLEEVCWHLQIAESTWHRWLNQYGGMKSQRCQTAERARDRERPTETVLADAELDKSMLKEIASGNF